jgi:two-component system response regulator (stage 0 sporulation protein A)
MKKLRVLVADGQETERNKLVGELAKNIQINIVGSVGNGKEAYDIFERKNPDVIIFDLLLPVYDGYTLLHKMSQHGIDKKVKLIMTTPLTSNLLISEAFNKGVDYILVKPYNLDIMVSQINKIQMRMNDIATIGTVESNQIFSREYSRTIEESISEEGQLNLAYKKIDNIISDKLNQLGIPVRLKGYRYMITAVKEVLNNKEAMEAVTKVLYPDVAKKHNSTPQRVEKAIRHAIEVAWTVDSENPTHKEFGYMKNTKKTRPTNSEFIAKISQDIRQIA